MEDQKWIDELRNSEVLLIFDDIDDLKVKKYILPEFQKAEINLKYVLPETHFPYGEKKIKIMPKAIEHSKKVLIILSQHTRKNFKCTLEIFLALEKCLNTNTMCVTIALLDNLDKNDIPKIPMLEHSMIARLTENDQPYTIKKVVENIRSESEDLRKKMPAGNLATGLAWSHFLGYLNILLPELTACITECHWFTKNPGKMSTRFYMLLPKSAESKALQDLDNNIMQAGNLKIEIAVAGTKRTYTPNVYCIQDTVHQTSYYCCAEIPSAFGCIGKIFFEKLGQLNAQQRNLEVDRFYHVLNQILNHEKNKKCHMLYEIITYNDEDKTEEGLPSTHLLRSIRKEQSRSDDEDSQPRKQFEYDACILYGIEDKDQALNVKSKLEGQHRLKVTETCPKDSTIPQITDKVKKSKWIVLILSKNDTWIEFWLAELLCVEEDEESLCVLPLLYNVEPDSIPNFIKWLTYIEAKDSEDYIARISEIVGGQRVSLKTQSPVGNVHHGLVWGFVVNYLRHVLPEISKRIEQKLKELNIDFSQPTNHYHSGLLEIIPMNCIVPASLEAKTPEYQITNMGRITALEIQKTIRIFACNLYLLKKDGHCYYFAGEFATPIRTLHGMGASVICGLPIDKMKKEAELFTEKLEKIIHSEPNGRDCTILRLTENDDMVRLIVDEIEHNEQWRKSLR